MGRRLGEATAGLDGIRDRLEAWRGTPGHGRGIPEEIWQAAAKLAQCHGVHRVARALRLNYDSLKQRVPCSPTLRRGAFVDLTLPPSMAATPPVASVELEAAGGAKLTVRLPGHSPSDVALVAGALWSQRG